MPDFHFHFRAPRDSVAAATTRPMATAAITNNTSRSTARRDERVVPSRTMRSSTCGGSAEDEDDEEEEEEDDTWDCQDTQRVHIVNESERVACYTGVDESCGKPWQTDRRDTDSEMRVWALRPMATIHHQSKGSLQTDRRTAARAQYWRTRHL
jgi:hypothetical protein